MCKNRRVLIGVALFAMAVMATGCCQQEHLRQTELAREVAELRQRLQASQKREQGSQQGVSPSHIMMLGTGFLPPGVPRNPVLAGRVSKVSGGTCTVMVDANPGDTNIHQAIQDRSVTFSLYDDDGFVEECQRCAMRFSIYGVDGFKQQVEAIRFDAAANAVICRALWDEQDLQVAVGDKADTHLR